VRAVGYVRVSSEEQVQGLSLDAQRREIARYCEQHGHELLEFYADEGVSAYTDQIAKRPAFSALLEAAQRREFDVVVVHTLDRWARRSSVQATTLERLGHAGVGFASVTEQMDYTTPAGRLLLATMGGVAEFFSAQLGVHVRKAKREGFEQGRFAGGVPFGYRSEGGVALVVPEEAEAVREAFVRRDRGDRLAAIAADLNAQGLHTRRGNAFTPWAIKDLLTCRFYLGTVSYQGEERDGAHEAIVERGLFEAVQQRRVERKAGRRQGWVTNSLLTGRVACARCGRAIWSDRTAAGTPLYREQHGQACGTLGRSFTAAIVDAQVAALVGALRLDDGLLQEAAEAAQGRTSIDATSVDAIDGELKRLARAYGDGAYTEAEYDGRRDAILARRRRLVAAAGGGDIGEAAALIRDLPRLWREASIEQRREILGCLFEAVEVDMERRRIESIVAVAAFDALLREAAVIVAAEEMRLSMGGGDGGGLTPSLTQRSSRRWRLEWPGAA